MTPPEWTAIIDKYGLAFAAVAGFMIGLIRGTWVMGRELADKDKQLEEKRAEIVELKALVRENGDTVQKSVHTNWQMVGTLKEFIARYPEVLRRDEPPSP